MKYQELKALFQNHENGYPCSHLTGYITFSSFGPNARRDYTKLERTYVVSSNNKAFQPNKGGYSIFASCLDGKTDPCVRLEQYMADERGGKDGWKVEDCCLIGYLLIGMNERNLLEPQHFCTQEDAMEAMLRELSRESGESLDVLLDNFRHSGGEVESDCYGITANSAWLNAPMNGNWDWYIEPVRVYGTDKVFFGQLLPSLS